MSVLAEDCLAYRRAMADLVSLARAPEPDRATAEAVMGFLRDEVPLQLECTKRDLFPILRQRAEPDDGVDVLLARLERDDQDMAGARKRVLKILWAISVGRNVSAERRAQLAAYAETECERLALEQAVMMPLARVRLTKTDREQLLRSMSGRRGWKRGADPEPSTNDGTAIPFGKEPDDERGGAD